jgi:hypothetical protein
VSAGSEGVVDINYGIKATGSARITADAMAAGTNAQANAGAHDQDGPKDIDELRALLGELIVQLRETAPQIDDGDELVAAAKLADRELRKDQPDKHTVLGLLRAVESGVAAFAGLAGAVVTLQQAVMLLF